MKIGIDLDGCLYDFTKDYHSYIVNIQGIPADEIVPVTSWDFYEHYGFSVHEFLDHLRDGADREFIFRNGEPAFRSIITLEFLKAEGHTLHIVTDRGRFGASAIQSTVDWLHQYEIPFDSLTFGQNKTLVNVDLFVDDSPENLRALKDAGTRTVRFAQEWNVTAEADYTIITWEALPILVAHLEALV